MNGEWCPLGTGFPFGEIKTFGTGEYWWLYNIMHILNSTESYTLKWLKSESSVMCIYHNKKSI